MLHTVLSFQHMIELFFLCIFIQAYIHHHVSQDCEEFASSTYSYLQYSFKLLVAPSVSQRSQILKMCSSKQKITFQDITELQHNTAVYQPGTRIREELDVILESLTYSGRRGSFTAVE